MNNKLDTIVIVIDTSDKTYYSHHVFCTASEAFAFAEGMEEAWEISHGTYNCWCPFSLGISSNFEEWKEMGFPGKEIIEKVIGEKINE